MYDKKSRENSTQLKRQEDSKQEKWFKPQVASKTDEIIAMHRPELLNESSGQRDTRLSHEDSLAREKRRKEIEQIVYGGITFAPTIDPLSRALGRESDLNELYENTRGKRVKDLARKKLEDERSKHCSFKPKIVEYRSVGHSASSGDEYNFSWTTDCPVEEWGRNARAASKASASNNPRTDRDQDNEGYIRSTINLKQPEKMAREIRRQLQDREEYRQGELAAREIEELAPCTFHPQIPTYIPPHLDEPVVVRGIGRHLELKHLKEKLRTDKAAREEEVFKVRHSERFRKAENGATIIEVLTIVHHSTQEYTFIVCLFSFSTNFLTTL